MWCRGAATWRSSKRIGLVVWAADWLACCLSYCFTFCFGLAMLSTCCLGALAEWSDGWLAKQPVRPLTGRLLAAPCGRGPARPCLWCRGVGTWQPRKRIGFELNRIAAKSGQNSNLLAMARNSSQNVDLGGFCGKARTAAKATQNGKLLAGPQKCSQMVDLARFCKESRTASKI